MTNQCPKCNTIFCGCNMCNIARQDKNHVCAQCGAAWHVVTLSIAEWQKEVHKNAEEHGWWEHDGPEVSTQIANIASEVFEAWEQYVKGGFVNRIWFSDCEREGTTKKPEGFGIELADCVIRIMDTCEAYGLDLEKLIKMKHEFNKTRPYRHGGKKA